MEMRYAAKPVAVAAAAVIATLIVLLLGAGADANAGKGKAKVTTIDIVGEKERELAFEGPTAIKAGTELRIKNSTDIRKVGPHTFTLLKGRLIPGSNKEAKKCFAPGGVCDSIAQAHEFDPETETINKAAVEKGKKGWDTEFTAKRYGDSQYTEQEGEKFSRKLTAEAGDKLSYFCAIHPFMAGKIRVE